MIPDITSFKTLKAIDILDKIYHLFYNQVFHHFTYHEYTCDFLIKFSDDFHIVLDLLSIKIRLSKIMDKPLRLQPMK